MLSMAYLTASAQMGESPLGNKKRGAICWTQGLNSSRVTQMEKE